MNRSLSRLIVGMVMTGLVGAVLSSALIAWALRNGLRPLEWLVGEVATITPGTLFTRFESDGVPMEIEPVVQHVNGLLERLEEGFHRERRFNADLAHELRTPLAEIRSLIELGIRFPSEVNESQQQDILASSRRMERMVSAMLLLAQCEEAQPAQGEETSATKILLEECWQTHTAVAERRNVQLKCEIHQDAVLNGNGDLWRHLIGNLLSNAAAYAPEGSVVLVKDGPGFLLEISNVAPDLSEEDLGAMFDRLWRGDRARTGDEHCGLGLSIVQACADALWVRVEVSLSPNSDLTFRLSERREVS